MTSAPTPKAGCVACGEPLEPVFPGVDPQGYQFDNALWIGFFGGYGMFVDNMETRPSVIPGPPDASLVICHDCAHDLCDANPWIAAAINPEESHSHPHSRDWAGHSGWDLPHASG